MSDQSNEFHLKLDKRYTRHLLTFENIIYTSGFFKFSVKVHDNVHILFAITNCLES